MTAHDVDLVRMTKALEKIAKILEALGPVIKQAGDNILVVGQILNPPPEAVPNPPRISDWSEERLESLDGMTADEHVERFGINETRRKLMGDPDAERS